MTSALQTVNPIPPQGVDTACGWLALIRVVACQHSPFVFLCKKLRYYYYYDDGSYQDGDNDSDINEFSGDEGPEYDEECDERLLVIMTVNRKRMKTVRWSLSLIMTMSMMNTGLIIS